MAGNSFGTAFRFTTWGESHGPAIGCVIDGVPPRLPLAESDIQRWLDRRKPGQSRFTTQRREDDLVRILSGVFDGLTTGTPIQLLIENTDQRSKDYRNIADRFRPVTPITPIGRNTAFATIAAAAAPRRAKPLRASRRVRSRARSSAPA